MSFDKYFLIIYEGGTSFIMPEKSGSYSKMIRGAEERGKEVLYSRRRIPVEKTNILKERLAEMDLRRKNGESIDYWKELRGKI